MKAEFEEILSEPTISVPEAGRLLGLARNGAYEAAKRGEIPTIQLGRRIRVPTAKLKKMIE
jgi:excisionase family DNA binding protein